MKVNLVSLFIVSLCISDVFGAPNLKGIVDNANNISDSAFGLNETFESDPYSMLWLFNGSKEEFRTFQASVMLNYMNFSVDPCDDFYEYACGNWEKFNPIPEDQSRSTMFTILANNIQNELRGVLSQPVADNQDLGAEEKARLYFTTCTDEETINQRGAEPLLQFINELGGWPVLDKNWSEEDFDWLQLSIKTSLFGYPSVLCTAVSVDFKNTSRYTIILDKPDLGLQSRDEVWKIENDQHWNAYRDLIVAVLKLLNVDPVTANSTAEEIVDFEIQLFSSKSDHEPENLTPVESATTIEGLSKTYPSIDWLTYLSGVVETTLPPDEIVDNVASNYYDCLPGILRSAKPRTLANYMVWRGVYRFLNALSEDFRIALHAFKKSLSGQKEPAARWKECFQELNIEMGMTTAAMFARRYFNEDIRNEMIALLNETKDAFQDSLHEIDWIDESTKNLALKKLSQFTLSVGYPDFILNPVKLNELYSELEFAPSKHFENTLILEKYSSRANRKHLRGIVDKDEWYLMPAEVNAAYQLWSNRIFIPMGFLMPPNYQRHFPRALFYAGIGVTMGHEVVHGFDSVGQDFDPFGTQTEWWSRESVKEFKDRVNCFTEQYGKISIDGISLDADMTKDENIADNGGLRQAYKVYQKWQSSNGRDESLEKMPGLNLTNNQLFFLSYAQVFCTAIRPEELSRNIELYNHSPGQFRIIGNLRNLKEFSDAFQCPTGSGMNPQTKCRLW